jgi:hypothetical protein
MASAFEGSRDCCHIYLGCAGRSSTRAHSETVVPVVNTSSTRRTTPSSNQLGPYHDEFPADIFAPLVPAEPGLRLAFAMPCRSRTCDCNARRP